MLSVSHNRLVVSVLVTAAKLHHPESRRFFSACQIIAGVAFIEVFEVLLIAAFGSAANMRMRRCIRCGLTS